MLSLHFWTALRSPELACFIDKDTGVTQEQRSTPAHKSNQIIEITDCALKLAQCTPEQDSYLTGNNHPFSFSSFFPSAAVPFGRWSSVNTAIPKILWTFSALQQGYRGRSVICDIHFTFVPFLWEQFKDRPQMIYLAAIQACLLFQSAGRRNWGNPELEKCGGRELSHLSVGCTWGTDWNRVERGEII